MLQDLIKALNEFLSSLGIKETITQHEDISITERAFNVRHNPDDKDIVIIGGQDIDGDFGHILSIGDSQYAISADQYRRLEYFNRTYQLFGNTDGMTEEKGKTVYTRKLFTPDFGEFNILPSYTNFKHSFHNRSEVVQLAQRILKKGKLKCVSVTNSNNGKIKFLKFKQKLSSINKLLLTSSIDSLSFDFTNGANIKIVRINGRLMQLHDSTAFVGQECYPDVKCIDPLFDPVHGYMADNARRANENPYMRTRSGLFGKGLKPRLVVEHLKETVPSGKRREELETLANCNGMSGAHGTPSGYAGDRDQYVNETPYVRKDLTPEQLEQLQANIEQKHSGDLIDALSIAQRMEKLRDAVEERNPCKKITVIGFPSAAGAMSLLMADIGTDK